MDIEPGRSAERHRAPWQRVARALGAIAVLILNSTVKLLFLRVTFVLYALYVLYLHISAVGPSALVFPRMSHFARPIHEVQYLSVDIPRQISKIHEIPLTLWVT